MKTTWKKWRLPEKKLRLTEKKLEPPESRPIKDYGRTSPTQYVLNKERWLLCEIMNREDPK